MSTPRIAADPVEQLVQKRIELEMGEAGVHDRLHVLDPPARRPLRLEGPGMRDRDRDAVGGQLEQVDLVPRELSPLQRADVEDADRPAVEDERDAGEAGDSLPADQRVEDVGVLDVGEHDRAEVGAPLSGEPFAESGTAAELLLDPGGA